MEQFKPVFPVVFFFPDCCLLLTEDEFTTGTSFQELREGTYSCLEPSKSYYARTRAVDSKDRVFGFLIVDETPRSWILRTFLRDQSMRVTWKYESLPDSLHAVTQAAKTGSVGRAKMPQVRSILRDGKGPLVRKLAPYLRPDLEISDGLEEASCDGEDR